MDVCAILSGGALEKLRDQIRENRNRLGAKRLPEKQKGHSYSTPPTHSHPYAYTATGSSCFRIWPKAKEMLSKETKPSAGGQQVPTMGLAVPEQSPSCWKLLPFPLSHPKIKPASQHPSHTSALPFKVGVYWVKNSMQRWRKVTSATQVNHPGVQNQNRHS